MLDLRQRGQSGAYSRCSRILLEGVNNILDPPEQLQAMSQRHDGHGDRNRSKTLISRVLVQGTFHYLSYASCPYGGMFLFLSYCSVLHDLKNFTRMLFHYKRPTASTVLFHSQSQFDMDPNRPSSLHLCKVN